MAAYSFDSSALVKRYVAEAGSVWVGQITDPAAKNRIHTARLTSVEVVSAVARRLKGGSISAQDAIQILLEFRKDFAKQFRKVNLWAAIVDRAASFAERHGLRAYDAMHLAAALEVQLDFAAMGLDVVFVSSDHELNEAAQGEGFTIEDPTKHP